MNEMEWEVMNEIEGASHDQSGRGVNDE